MRRSDALDELSAAANCASSLGIPFSHFLFDPVPECVHGCHTSITTAFQDFVCVCSVVIHLVTVTAQPMLFLLFGFMHMALDAVLQEHHICCSLDHGENKSFGKISIFAFHLLQGKVEKHRNQQIESGQPLRQRPCPRVSLEYKTAVLASTRCEYWAVLDVVHGRTSREYSELARLRNRVQSCTQVEYICTGALQLRVRPCTKDS